ncbi:DddA-like double-stranded DNA deaminase toxin [Stackebrandtia nassauensis]|uniref:Uncharacterized protein n=1 Tax=Stackebrandtia nassauensis (strain DSM 44728 / CIP 108903 / NRRL B-16338 / NBRC 102104 / LLR-40K-21) TaxID=446470 RepID=D3Q4D5_STANL|nr:DddA-like double-stranded DNA deaminase toxin [Stackebrandtia nassauensis]ADD40095.1 hypothetical protein Snas_0378 [Stackebrandtia nassauensis DSM 44728]
MGSVAELIAAVRAALSTLAEGRTLTNQARATLEEATGRMEGIARGSASYQLRNSLDALAAAVAGLDRMAEAENAAQEHVIAYLASIGADGRAPEPEPEKTSPKKPTASSDLKAIGERLGLKPCEGLLGTLPAMKPNSGQRTRGRWHKHPDRELTSGANDRDWEHVKDFWHHNIWSGTAEDTEPRWLAHLELKFAMTMRRTRTKSEPVDQVHEEITINHPDGPCPQCQLLLPYFLEEGSSLTIHWPAGSATYIGRPYFDRPLRDVKPYINEEQQ